MAARHMSNASQQWPGAIDDAARIVHLRVTRRGR